MIDRAEILPVRAPRTAGRLVVPALAALHPLIFRFVGPEGAAGFRAWVWPASAVGALLYFLVRDFATARKRDRLPDISAALAWGSAAAIEAAALSAPLAASKLVPAVLFPLLGVLLPLPDAAVFGCAAGCLMLLGFSGVWPTFGWDAGILAMGVLGVGTGQAVRRKLSGPRKSRGDARSVLDRSRSILSPWEAASPATDGGAPGAGGEAGLLKWRAELEDGIRRALEGVLPATGADAVYFVTPSPDPGSAFASRSVVRNGAEEALLSLRIPDSFGPAREAILFRRAFLAEGDEAADWPVGEGARAVRFTAVAAAPVFVGGQTEGAVVAVRSGDEGWAGPVVQLLETAAFFIAREHDRARESYRQARYLARQEGLHEIVRRIADVSERGVEGDARVSEVRRAVYRAAVGQIREMFHLDRVLLIEGCEPWEERAGSIAWEEGGGEAGKARGDRVPLGGTYAEWVLENRKHRIFSGAAGRPTRHPVLPAEWAREGDRAYLLVPVSGAGGFRGAVACIARDARAFDGRDAQAVGEIVSVMTMGISHALRTEALSREAERDGLTGLYNQKTFRRLLGSVVARLDERYPCALLMLDIDHFKKINDVHGHPVGDDVLRSVSSIIAKTIRKADIAGRYGGEEFAIYLHQADRANAEMGAERLRLMIEKSRLQSGGKEITVTASLGVACYPAHGRTPEELLRRADEALYRSKHGGRNRVTVA